MVTCHDSGWRHNGTHGTLTRTAAGSAENVTVSDMSIFLSSKSSSFPTGIELLVVLSFSKWLSATVRREKRHQKGERHAYSEGMPSGEETYLAMSLTNPVSCTIGQGKKRSEEVMENIHV